MNFKPLIMEFVIAAPVALAVSYAITQLLKEDLRLQKPGKLISALVLLILTTLTLARLTPIASYAYFQSIDPAVQQNEALQLKAQFMQELDLLVGNPTKITKETKSALFKKFQTLFPNGEKDRNIYLQNLLNLLECNEAYFADALEAFKSKKNQKSEKRKTCQQQDGTFFNRKYLIAEEQSKLNDQVIETIANGKKIIQDNKEIEINEGVLKQNIEQQQKNKDMLRTIFSEEK